MENYLNKMTSEIGMGSNNYGRNLPVPLKKQAQSVLRFVIESSRSSRVNSSQEKSTQAGVTMRCVSLMKAAPEDPSNVSLCHAVAFALHDRSPYIKEYVSKRLATVF